MIKIGSHTTKSSAWPVPYGNCSGASTQKICIVSRAGRCAKRTRFGPADAQESLTDKETERAAWSGLLSKCSRIISFRIRR